MSDIDIDSARKAQLTRTAIVALLNDTNFAEILKGSFVRVLLELENGTEDYRAGYVRGVDNGASYNGFTHDSSVSTTTYLVLDLPGELRGINGSSFMLNSISNSPLSPTEIEDWRRTNRELPRKADLVSKSQALQPVLDRLPRRRAPPSAAPSSANSAVPPSSSSSNVPGPAPTVMNNTHAPGGQQSPATAQPHASTDTNTNAHVLPVVAAAGGAHEAALGATRRQPAAHNSPLGANADFNATTGGNGRDDSEVADELPTEEQVRRMVMEQLREKSQIFPSNVASLNTSVLRLTERDLNEYLERVREQLGRSRPTCVVCMDKPPTVISLPCKHQVLCRLCAAQVKCCPLCRESCIELFEPLEL